MLTIREPIELKSLNRLQTTPDTLNQKIGVNYGVINSGITSQDLLHLVAAPREVYLEEGNMTNLIFNDSTVQNQNTKIEMVNNLLNRVLISDTAEFTYQDSVFVTNVLNKLGITDVNAFIKNVNELREENRNVDQLIRLYWENGEKIKEIATEIRNEALENQGKEDDVEENKEIKGRYYLHSDIYNRLKSAVIYNELNRFYKSTPQNSAYINQNEYNISEQLRISENILLAELKKEYTLENKRILENHINKYEIGTEQNSEITRETVMRDMASAVLLNMVDNVYQIRKDEITEGQNVWYNINNIFYKGAENTLKRYEAYHVDGNIVDSSQINYTEDINRIYEYEISLLKTFAQDIDKNIDYVSVENNEVYNRQTTMVYNRNDTSEVVENQYENQNNVENNFENSTNEEIITYIENNISEDIINPQMIKIYREIVEEVKNTPDKEVSEDKGLLIRDIAIDIYSRIQEINNKKLSVDLRINNDQKNVNDNVYLKNENIQNTDIYGETSIKNENTGFIENIKNEQNIQNSELSIGVERIVENWKDMVHEILEVSSYAQEVKEIREIKETDIIEGTEFRQEEVSYTSVFGENAKYDVNTDITNLEIYRNENKTYSSVNLVDNTTEIKQENASEEIIQNENNELIKNIVEEYTTDIFKNDVENTGYTEQNRYEIRKGDNTVNNYQSNYDETVRTDLEYIQNQIFAEENKTNVSENVVNFQLADVYTSIVKEVANILQGTVSEDKDVLVRNITMEIFRRIKNVNETNLSNTINSNIQLRENNVNQNIENNEVHNEYIKNEITNRNQNQYISENSWSTAYNQYNEYIQKKEREARSLKELVHEIIETYNQSEEVRENTIFRKENSVEKIQNQPGDVQVNLIEGEIVHRDIYTDVNVSQINKPENKSYTTVNMVDNITEINQEGEIEEQSIIENNRYIKNIVEQFTTDIQRNVVNNTNYTENNTFENPAGDNPVNYQNNYYDETVRQDLEYIQNQIINNENTTNINENIINQGLVNVYNDVVKEAKNVLRENGTKKDNEEKLIKNITVDIFKRIQNLYDTEISRNSNTNTRINESTVNRNIQNDIVYNENYQNNIQNRNDNQYTTENIINTQYTQNNQYVQNRENIIENWKDMVYEILETSNFAEDVKETRILRENNSFEKTDYKTLSAPIISEIRQNIGYDINSNVNNLETENNRIVNQESLDFVDNITELNQQENIEETRYDIRQELDRINQQNVEIHNKVTNEAKDVVHHTRVIKPDAKQVMKDALKAINNQEIIYENRQDINKNTDIEFVKNVVENYASEETKNILSRVSNTEINHNMNSNENSSIVYNENQYDDSVTQDLDYIQNLVMNNKSEATYNRNEVEKNNELLISEINAINNEIRNAEISNKVENNTDSFLNVEQRYDTVVSEYVEDRKQDILKNVTEEVVQRYYQSPEGKTHTRYQRQENINFIHKAVENTIDEEFVENILKNRDVLKNQETQTNSTVVTNKFETKNIENINTNIIDRREMELTELIEKNISKEIGNISDKVYAKIEKKLLSERRRRGY